MQFINKDCSKCSRRKWYQIGYEDGMKAGLKQGNEILEQLLKEHQHKMDKILVYGGEE